MNINVSLPPLIPTQLQPQVEAARTDNRRAELIPQARQGQASSAESEVGSQKEKSKAAQASSNQTSQNSRETGQPAPTTSPDNRFVEATGEEGQRKQQDPKQQEQRQEQQVQDLIERDQEVRTHEQAHQSAGGEYASSPTYQFTQGPDGKRYATGGEVQIDTSAVPGDPAATIAKMQQIRSAALAPAEPSAQDLAVARSAAASEAKARKELMAEQSAKSGGVLSAYMDKRNSVIAGHYQQAVNPAANQSLSLHI